MKSLTVEKGNYVTTVTLDRVEKRNAMSLSMWQALGDLYQELETDYCHFCLFLMHYISNLYNNWLHCT